MLRPGNKSHQAVSTGETSGLFRLTKHIFGLFRDRLRGCSEKDIAKLDDDDDDDDDTCHKSQNNKRLRLVAGEAVHGHGLISTLLWSSWEESQKEEWENCLPLQKKRRRSAEQPGFCMTVSGST